MNYVREFKVQRGGIGLAYSPDFRQTLHVLSVPPEKTNRLIWIAHHLLDPTTFPNPSWCIFGRLTFFDGQTEIYRWEFEYGENLAGPMLPNGLPFLCGFRASGSGTVLPWFRVWAVDTYGSAEVPAPDPAPKAVDLPCTHFKVACSRVQYEVNYLAHTGLGDVLTGMAIQSQY